VAPTVIAASIDTLQPGPVPEHAPDQPANLLPGSGVAARLTSVPSTNDPTHVDPQSTPPDADTTRPAPAPERFTVSAHGVSATWSSEPAATATPLDASVLATCAVVKVGFSLKSRATAPTT
jgi:hypothetical protein